LELFPIKWLEGLRWVQAGS